MLTLKSITIKNFKNITDTVIPLTKLNEIYGANRTGKTAVLQAVQFCLVGGKNDKSKIKTGEEKATVELSMFSDKTPIEIKTSINQKGDVRCQAEVGGVKHQNPRTFIRKLLSYGAFDPRIMIEKKDRLKRLLSLIPIKLTEEDLMIPDEDQLFPIHDKSNMDYSKHGFEVLNDLDKDLRNVRHSLGQKKDLLKKSYSEWKKTHETNISDFKINFRKDPFDKTIPSYESSISGIEKLKAENEHKIEKYNENTKNLTNLKRRGEQILHANATHQQMIIDKEKEIALITTEIEKLKHNRKINDSSLKELRKEINEIESKSKNLKDDMEEFQAKLHAKQNQMTMSKEANKLLDSEKFLEKKFEEFKKAEMYWEIQDILIKKKFPLLKAKILNPLQEKVPGLQIDSEGNFTLNNTSIDELSGSESLQLGLKFKAIGAETDELVLINDFECMDIDSIKGVDWGKFHAIVARVADTPIGGEWNSTEMKEETAQEEVTNDRK